MKQCSKCKEIRDKSEFAKGRRQCKFCKSAMEKAYRERNAERIAITKRKWKDNNRKRYTENQKRWRKENMKRVGIITVRWTKKNPIKHFLITAKGRAKKLGLPFNLTLEDIVIPDVCPVLGIPLAPSTEKRSDNSPSLDRIDNTKGYIKGNVAIISWRANRLKSNSTLEELKSLVDWLEISR